METAEQNEKVHDSLYRKRYSLNNIGNCLNKNILLTSNQEIKNNKRLNKDIMHLIKDEIKNRDKNDITIEENIKYEYNISNKQSSVILPFIKLNDLIINPISSLGSKKSQKNEDSKRDSNFIGNKVSERKNSLEKLNKKNYSKTSVINYKINIPNLNLNKDKNIIKRNLNINSMLNTMIIDNKIENKKFCRKAKIIKNKDILEKKIEFKNHQYFNNINNNPFLISLSNDKKIKNNCNLHKNYSMNNITNLNECYINTKLIDAMKQIENRYKATIDIKKRNLLNNSSIKSNIFNYYEIISRIKRINALETIKQKNEMFNEFQNNTNINLRKENNINRKNISVKDIIQYMNENDRRKNLRVKKIKNTFQNKIKKDKFPQKENNKNETINLIFSYKDKCIKEFNKLENKKIGNTLIKNEYNQLYNI